ncbi:hypothetical protein AAIH70_25605 [Neorhizobium sp. BT27B]|uniref:hypothetical protein n=1 Tax=Neorhizobium sp. BT27B TaxID=3142625 RepID=UPI003D276167
MEKILLWVGWIGIAIVIFALLAIVAAAGRGYYPMLALVAALPWAAPALVGFVLVAAFGSMLAQLKAIRAASERQADIFQKLFDRKPSA